MKKTKKHYSLKERRAYWVGVGMAANRKGKSNKMLNGKNPQVNASMFQGIKDFESKDMAGKLK